MSLSLNEVETLAKRAARGAGYPWGLAEEAARATRWLCARSLDGCADLAALLRAVDGADLTLWTPATGLAWSASGEALCPVITGAAMSDRAGMLRGAELRMHRVARPILLAPFAAMAAQHLGITVALRWDATLVVTDGERLSVTGPFETPVTTVTVTTDLPVSLPLPFATRATPSAPAAAVLTEFAHRTYAPATEESRLKGAGAGLSDND